jgi:hypothetical protein
MSGLYRERTPKASAQGMHDSPLFLTGTSLLKEVYSHLPQHAYVNMQSPSGSL